MWEGSGKNDNKCCSTTTGEIEDSQGLQNIRRTGTNMYSRSAAAVRNHFMEYFNNEGAVPWQWNNV